MNPYTDQSPDRSSLMNLLDTIRENMAQVIIGRKNTIDLLLTALLADGHVLLEDVPGTGKTMTAKSLAKSLDLQFSRIQFTPDLLPSDVTGLNYFDQKESRFVLRRGPVFTHILLADEINRATQNPVETAGTYPLPEAQLDRFLMEVSMGYPDREGELAILERFGARNPLDTLGPVCTTEELAGLRKAAKEVYVHPLMKAYIVDLCQATRTDSQILNGVSPRGTLALFRAVRAYAMVQGRDYVVPEDVKALAVPVLAHRLTTARSFGSKSSAKEITERLLSTVSLPTEDWRQRV